MPLSLKTDEREMVRDADVVPLGPEIAALPDGRLFAAWSAIDVDSRERSVQGLFLDGDGSPLGVPFDVATGRLDPSLDATAARSSSTVSVPRSMTGRIIWRASVSPRTAPSARPFRSRLGTTTPRRPPR